MDVRSEPATAAAEYSSAPANASFTVTVAETAESFPVRAGMSILEGMHRLGRRGIPVGCRSGGCSVCKVEVIEGENQKNWRQIRPMSREYVSDEDLAAGRVLACCITPLESVTLRVIGKMRKSFKTPQTPSGA